MAGSLIGCAGRLLLPTRGDDGPGEALMRYAGGTEAVLVWSDHRLEIGTVVVAVSRRGPREFDVVAWDELDLPPPPPDVPS